MIERFCGFASEKDKGSPGCLSDMFTSSGLRLQARWDASFVLKMDVYSELLQKACVILVFQNLYANRKIANRDGSLSARTWIMRQFLSRREGQLSTDSEIDVGAYLCTERSICPF